uniref:Uncharacterized protein n=1 Tax=Mus spicilegus TaxID=10103 RepID=A0A8C6HC48_MUSSI
IDEMNVLQQKRLFYYLGSTTVFKMRVPRLMKTQVAHNAVKTQARITKGAAEVCSEGTMTKHQTESGHVWGDEQTPLRGHLIILFSGFRSKNYPTENSCICKTTNRCMRQMGRQCYKWHSVCR